MRRLSGAMLLAATLGLSQLRAGRTSPKVTEILDKAIKALGGEEKLAKVEAVTWKAKGKVTIDGNENEITERRRPSQGLDHYPLGVRGRIRRQHVQGRDRPQRRQGLAEVRRRWCMEMDGDAVANEKRTRLPHGRPGPRSCRSRPRASRSRPPARRRSKGKPAVGLKVTGPDGKDFTLYFDKESGLPVRHGGQGRRAGRATSTPRSRRYSDYKDFDGIKKATKVSVKRDGDDFVEQEITEFKVLDKVPAETFAEPK